MNEDLLSMASDIVERARRLGADEVDAYVVSSTESSVQVRRGAIERVKEAGSQTLGLRVITGKRTSVCATSDLTPRILQQFVQDAVDLASISEPDQYAGLPDRTDLASGREVSLQLYDERIDSLSADEMRDMALRCESAAFDHDPRVTNSDGAEMAVKSHVVDKDMVRLDLGGSSFISFPMTMVDKIMNAGRDVFLNPTFHPSNQAVAGAPGSGVPGGQGGQGGPGGSGQALADTAVQGGGGAGGFNRQPNAKGGAGVMLGEVADTIPSAPSSRRPYSAHAL